MADTDTAAVRIEASTGGLEAGLRGAASSVESAFSSMKGQAEALTGVFDALKTGLLGLAAALGADFMMHAVESFVRFGEQVEHTSELLGITTEASSALSIALKEIGSSNEVYESAIIRLDRQLKTHEDQLHKIGVVTRDSSGALVGQTQLFENAKSALLEYKEGTDRNQMSLALFGRSINDITPLLRLNQDVLEGAAQKARAFGIEMSENDVLAARNFSMQMADLKVALSAVMMTLGRELLPVLVQFVTWLNTNGPSAINTFKSALSGIGTVAHAIEMSFSVLTTVVGQVLVTIAVGLQSLFSSLGSALEGKFKDAFNTLKAGITDIGGVWKTGFDQSRSEIDKFYAYLKAKQTEAGAAMGGATGGLTPLPKGSKSAVALQEPKSQIGEWKEQLEQLHESQTMILAKMSQEDLAFWQDILGHAKMSKADRIAVEHEIYTAKREIATEAYQADKAALDFQLTDTKKNYEQRIAILKQEADLAGATYGKRSTQYAAALRAIEAEEVKHKEELRRLQGEELAQAEAHQVALLDLERQRIDFEATTGRISATERIRQEQEVEDREYAIKLAGLNQRKALYADDLKEQQKINAQIEALQDAHAAHVMQSQFKTTEAIQSDWLQVTSSMTRSWDGAIQGWLQGTQTFRQGMSKILLGMVTDFISMCLRMIAEWGAMELAKSGITTAQSVLRSILGIKDAATSVAIGKTAAASNIGAQAGVAGAAATASAAAIPIYGWAIAPEAGAAAFASAMGYMGALGLESGMWEVPGVLPAILHPGEMVVPAGPAEAMRSGGGGSGTNLSIHVTAMDSKDVIRALKHGGALHKALQHLNRNFAPA